MAQNPRSLLLIVAVAAAAFVAAWLSAGSAHAYYDYTHRIATSFLEGRLGLNNTPPPWLNEMVPFGDRYYSVFPLGSVLCALPFSALVKIELLGDFPLRFVIAGLGAVITVLAFLLSGAFPLPLWKRLLYAAVPLFGSCLWPNLSFGGAWQVALGFAVAGELGALIFTLVYPRPFLAGFCFAVAFGNRTEILLTAPIFYYFLLRACENLRDLLREWPVVLRFSAVPAVLGILTLAYNSARFGSPLDFGYARIPGVLDEPWYQHGIFSVQSVPLNLYQMLFAPWKHLPAFPWLVPSGWGGSIFLSSPVLFLLFRRGHDSTLLTAAWTAIAIITLLLWVHGNPGGWQVSYRYASLLFPWALLILLQSEPRLRVGWAPALIAASIAINAYATWIFCATTYTTP